MQFQDPLPKTNRNPNTAIALSFVPGLGQIYNLQPRKGLIFLAVGITNFLILSLLVMSSHIMAGITSFSQNYDIAPNHQLVITFSQLTWDSPAVILLALLFGAFVLFSMRDAYDIASKSTRKSIYADSLLELSEANSASYLFHISLMVSFLILAFFFLVPPLPKQQITSIEFIQTPEKEIQKPTKAKDKSTVNRKAQKKVRLDRNQFKQNKSQRAKPSQKSTQKVTAEKPVTQSQPNRINKIVKPQPVRHNPIQTGRPAPIPHVQPKTPSNSNPLLSLIPESKRTTPQPVMPKLLAMNPAGNAANLPLVAPVLKSGTLAPTAPVRSKKSSASGSAGLSPSIIPTSKMENGSGSKNKVRRLSKIGNGNKTGANRKHAGIPSPERVSSGSGKNIKNLISIKPSVGSSRPRPTGEKSDGKLDSSKTGDDAKTGIPPVEAGEPDFTRYMARLQRKIRQNWFPPKDVRSKRVEVLFSIHTNGTMSSLKIVKSSGSSQADRAALAAVRNAAPFNHLPEFSPSSVDVKFTFDYNVFKSGRRW